MEVYRAALSSLMQRDMAEPVARNIIGVQALMIQELEAQLAQAQAHSNAGVDGGWMPIESVEIQRGPLLLARRPRHEGDMTRYTVARWDERGKANLDGQIIRYLGPWPWTLMRDESVSPINIAMWDLWRTIDEP
jgi:hypothetical protein